MNQKGFINIILVIIVIALVGAGAYFVSTRQVTPPTPSSTPSPTPTPTPSPTPTSTLPPNNFYQATFQDFDLRCLGTGGSREFVVRTQAEYQRLIDTSPDLHPNPFLPCVDYKFPVINFSQKTLLGKSLTGGGCSSEVKKKVLRNDDSREVIYSITATFTGTCEMAVSYNNFILVPKIPEDYIVKFEVNSRSDL